MMSDLQMWAMLIGFGLPLVIATVNQPQWPGWARAAVTLLLAVAAGAGTAYFEGTLTGQRWARAALIVGVAAIAAYRMFWRPSGIAPGIETATSRSIPPAELPKSTIGYRY